MQKESGTCIINYDPQQRDIYELVIESLKNNYRDYVFSAKDKDIILEICKREGISLIYSIHNDRYGDIDYVEFIPVTFLKTPSRKSKILQINLKEIKSNSTRWKWTDLSKRTTPYIVKNR